MPKQLVEQCTLLVDESDNTLSTYRIRNHPTSRYRSFLPYPSTVPAHQLDIPRCPQYSGRPERNTKTLSISQTVSLDLTGECLSCRNSIQNCRLFYYQMVSHNRFHVKELIKPIRCPTLTSTTFTSIWTAAGSSTLPASASF